MFTEAQARAVALDYNKSLLNYEMWWPITPHNLTLHQLQHIATMLPASWYSMWHGEQFIQFLTKKVKHIKSNFHSSLSKSWQVFACCVANNLLDIDRGDAYELSKDKRIYTTEGISNVRPGPCTAM